MFGTKTLAAFLVCSCLLLPSCQEETNSRSLPLDIEPARLSLDTVSFGESTSGIFRLFNPSDQPITIERIGPTSCDCESLQLLFPERPNSPTLRLRGQPIGAVIQPGETVQIKLHFDATRFRQPVSWKSGAFVLAIQGHPATILEYEIDIWNPYWLEPWRVNLGDIGPRTRPWGEVSVRAHDAPHFNLLIPERIRGWEFQAKRHNWNDTTGYTIQFRPPPELPLGPFQEIFEISSDLPESPPVRFWVQGVVKSEIYAVPQSLLFHAQQKEQSIDLRTRGMDFQIDQIVFPGKSPIQIKRPLQELPEQQGWILQFHQTEDVSVLEEGTIQILTNHPEQGIFTLPYQLLPSKP